MKFVKGEIIGLENNKEYICLDCVSEGNKDYYYLLSNFKPVEVRFAKIENDSDIIEIIHEPNQVKELLEMFRSRIDLD